MVSASTTMSNEVDLSSINEVAKNKILQGGNNEKIIFINNSHGLFDEF